MMRAGHRLHISGARRFCARVSLSLPADIAGDPCATGLFSDSAGPWYQPVTSPSSWPPSRLHIQDSPVPKLVSDEMFFSPGYYLSWRFTRALDDASRGLQILSAAATTRPDVGAKLWNISRRRRSVRFSRSSTDPGDAAGLRNSRKENGSSRCAGAAQHGGFFGVMPASANRWGSKW